MCLDDSSHGIKDSADSFSHFQLDTFHEYKNQSFFWTGVQRDLQISNANVSQVCLATQTSLDRLDEILALADNWAGPISVAIFLPHIVFYLAKVFFHPDDRWQLCLV